ncbi:MAG: hypothetical protein R3C68_14235 [Myxococcota bacterium]
MKVGGIWQLCETAKDFGNSTCYRNVEVAPMVADLDRVVASTDVVYQSRWTTTPVTFPAGQRYRAVLKAYRSSNFSDQVIVILDGRDGSLVKVIEG